MRRFAFLAALAASALAGCNASAGSSDGGPTVSRNFEVGGFQAVSLAGSPNVIVTVGGAPSVRAEGPQEAIDRLEIRVENGELRIGSRGKSWSIGFSERAAVTVHVTVPSLGAARVGGSGTIRIDRVEGERFAAAIGGSGDIEVQQLRVAEAVFAIGGSGAIRAAGAAQRSDVDVGGSGEVDLGALDTRNAKIRVAGSGDVSARASETAEVAIFGSGDVRVAGGARCSVTKHGSGSVQCGDGA